ncbi:MAG: tetraacyldisaccharide 4'-kinase [Bacteroidales bacterium]|jgi:tetraacyldisaccharide 4'-kinase|nr:tetraacyldisaccharide 4'-kinase [Bacteroidales bacterium]
MIFIKILLFPFACLYGIAVGMRNKLFDWKVLPSKRYNIPIISVGNLSAGGTGKTPHTEYLVNLLKGKYKVAVLSRGYRRKTRGFIMVGQDHKQVEIGDEPMQYLKKFPDVVLAVDENRRRGISKILSEKTDTELILLDDAFQHRYVKPGKSILLTDYHHLYVNDYLLPTGMLREGAKGARRADYIIVTKTPRVFSPITRRNLVKDLHPKQNQRLFYSYVDYDPPVPFKLCSYQKPAAPRYNYIVMVAGVANSYPFQEYLRGICNELTVINFHDHHQYTANDLEKISREYQSIISKDKVIFTTEKDATRLDTEEFSSFLDVLPFYYVPIRIRFHDCDEIRFDKLILDYVQKNIGSR